MCMARAGRCLPLGHGDKACCQVRCAIASVRVIAVGLTSPDSDSEIRGNVLKSMLLNVLSLASIYLFDLLLFSLAKGEHHWLHRNVGWAYQVLWLLPVVGISLYLNVSPFHLGRFVLSGDVPGKGVSIKALGSTTAILVPQTCGARRTEANEGCATHDTVFRTTVPAFERINLPASISATERGRTSIPPDIAVA